MNHTSRMVVCMSPQRLPIHSKGYRSIHKRFVFRTQITEKADQVTVKRTILWYDSVKRTYRKKIEFQSYDCVDDYMSKDEFEAFIDTVNCN